MNNTLMWKEISEQPQAIKACEELNLPIICELAEKIKKRNPPAVIIAARGTSDHVATFAKYLIEIYCGIPVSLAAPSVFTAYGAQVKMEQCVVLAISQSGAGLDVFEVLHAAKKQGALTAAITNTPDSIIAKEADYHLYCNCGKEKSVAATKTFTTSLYLVTQLAYQLSGSPYLKAGLDCVVSACEYALTQLDAILEIVPAYRFMQECFVLSRGLDYPIAMEAALKVKETCYVRASSYSVSDFQHGPFAMVDSNIPTILIAVDPHTNEDAKNMLMRLQGENVCTLLITNDQALVPLASKTLLIPDWCNTIAACFAAGVLAQSFACELSLSKGNNPDAPRGLNKVTVTK